MITDAEARRALIFEAVEMFQTAMICGASLYEASEWMCSIYYPNGQIAEPKPFSRETPRLPLREWRELREIVLHRDGFACVYCGETDSAQSLCVDHIVPLSRSGSNDEDNLVACCRPCNTSKSDKLLSEWRGRQN